MPRTGASGGGIALVAAGGIPDGSVTFKDLSEPSTRRIQPLLGGHSGSGLSLYMTGQVSSPTTLLIGDKKVELPSNRPIALQTYQDWFHESCEIQCHPGSNASGEIHIRFNFRL